MSDWMKFVPTVLNADKREEKSPRGTKYLLFAGTLLVGVVAYYQKDYVPFVARWFTCVYHYRIMPIIGICIYFQRFAVKYTWLFSILILLTVFKRFRILAAVFAYVYLANVVIHFFTYLFYLIGCMLGDGGAIDILMRVVPFLIALANYFCLVIIKSYAVLLFVGKQLIIDDQKLRSNLKRNLPLHS